MCLLLISLTSSSIIQSPAHYHLGILASNIFSKNSNLFLHQTRFSYPWSHPFPSPTPNSLLQCFFIIQTSVHISFLDIPSWSSHFKLVSFIQYHCIFIFSISHTSYRNYIFLLVFFFFWGLSNKHVHSIWEYVSIVQGGTLALRTVLDIQKAHKNVCWMYD